MRILVKIGGAQLSEAAARAALAESVFAAQKDGHELILVHGGGDQIRQLTHRLGIEDHYVDGLRVTDAETAQVVLWVLGGEVNRKLVASLADRGLSAVGLTGADGGSFDALPLEREGADLGFVGQINQVRPQLAQLLLNAGQVPVFATVAPLASHSTAADAHFYNINADHAVAPLARALEVDAVLFLSDVPGVLEERILLPELSELACASRIASGVIHGGMLPKVESALRAGRENPGALVKIASAEGRDAIRSALQASTGTRFVPAASNRVQHEEAIPHG